MIGLWLSRPLHNEKCDPGGVLHLPPTRGVEQSDTDNENAVRLVHKHLPSIATCGCPMVSVCVRDIAHSSHTPGQLCSCPGVGSVYDMIMASTCCN